MLLAEAIALIRNPFINAQNPSVWADLGAGSGLFSAAIAGLTAPGSTVYAIDKIKPAIKNSYPADVSVISLKGDMNTVNFDVPPLDGIIAANSLHFIADHDTCLKRLHSLGKPNAVFIIVEYDTNKASEWIPYPLPYHSLKKLFAGIGYSNIIRLGQIKSIYNSSYIYSACITI
jgi:trans-aconitate methyltransferase